MCLLRLQIRANETAPRQIRVLSVTRHRGLEARPPCLLAGGDGCVERNKVLAQEQYRDPKCLRWGSLPFQIGKPWETTHKVVVQITA